MMNVERAKDWIRENVPMLMVLVENKYIGMLYDRFASLPGAKQKQVIVGTVGGVMGLIMIHLLYSYFSLWSMQRQISQSHSMVSMLNAYQREQREQSGDIRLIERNAALAGSGSLKNYLVKQGRAATISARLIQADETDEGGGGEDGEGTAPKSDIQMKRATVKLQRVNLTQLKNFLQSVEFGSYSLDVSSIKIQNDTKLRGYMDVELGIVAYLFGGSGGAGGGEEP